MCKSNFCQEKKEAKKKENVISKHRNRQVTWPRILSSHHARPCTRHSAPSAQAYLWPYDPRRILSQIPHLSSSREDQALSAAKLGGILRPFQNLPSCSLSGYLPQLSPPATVLAPPGPSESYPALCFAEQIGHCHPNLAADSPCLLPLSSLAISASENLPLCCFPPGPPVFSRCLSHIHQGISRLVLPSNHPFSC